MNSKKTESKEIKSILLAEDDAASAAGRAERRGVASMAGACSIGRSGVDR